jgi:hypothetical protein
MIVRFLGSNLRLGLVNESLLNEKVGLVKQNYKITCACTLELRQPPRWRFSGFCKTQYASLHGWDYFKRCHCAVVHLLAVCRTPDLRVKIMDEGAYWPRRSASKLRENLDRMNGLIAATASVLKDAADGNPDAIKSPIFAHKNFERLEAQGAPQVAAAVEELRALLRK